MSAGAYAEGTTVPAEKSQAVVGAGLEVLAEPEWREPPEALRGGEAQYTVRLAPARRMLREHPGRWAMVARSRTSHGAAKLATNIRAGKYGFKLTELWESCSRMLDDDSGWFGVFVRYQGDEVPAPSSGIAAAGGVAAGGEVGGDGAGEPDATPEPVASALPDDDAQPPAELLTNRAAVEHAIVAAAGWCVPAEVHGWNEDAEPDPDQRVEVDPAVQLPPPRIGPDAIEHGHTWPTTVEIGGQTMTEAQYDAARAPLTEPDPEPTAPPDEARWTPPAEPGPAMCVCGHAPRSHGAEDEGAMCRVCDCAGLTLAAAL